MQPQSAPTAQDLFLAKTVLGASLAGSITMLIAGLNLAVALLMGAPYRQT